MSLFSSFHFAQLILPYRNGSLYRMDAKQRREAVRLIRAHCSFYDNGNCLYLDDGEEVVCPQITSFSVICAFFCQVVLKDEAARGLEAKLFRRENNAVI